MIVSSNSKSIFNGSNNRTAGQLTGAPLGAFAGATTTASSVAKLFAQIRLMLAAQLSTMIAVLLLLVCAFAVAPAAAQVDAYSIEVAVSDRSAAEQADAYQIAMRQVLLANSGDKTLLNRNDVRRGLQSAEQYVKSFSYRAPAAGTVINRSTPLTAKVRSTGQATQLMLVQFEPTQINELIRQKRKAAKTDENEVVVDPLLNVQSALLWLVVQEQGGGALTLIGGKQGANVMQRAREIAGVSGVSLMFPAADAADGEALTEQDITEARIERLRAATARYAQPVSVVALLSRTRTGGWQSQWIKYSEQSQATTRGSSASLDAALQQALNWLKPGSDQNASVDDNYQYGGTGVSATEALVWVSPLRTTAGYAEVMAFLSGIDSVSTVYPKEVSDAGTVFAVIPRNAANAINAAAAGRSWLQRSANPGSLAGSEFANSIVLSFEYLR